MRKRYAFTCLLVLLAAPALPAQDALPAMPSADSVASDWEVQFPDAASRRDFKRLREYRLEKQSTIHAEQGNQDMLQSIRQQIERETQTRGVWASELSGLLDNVPADSSETYVHQSYPLEFDTFLGAATPGPVLVSDLRNAERRLAQQDSVSQLKLAAIDSVGEVFALSINTLQGDIRKAEAAIDNALAPEYQSQKFRTLVSAFFALLIGVMIVAFFGTIYKKAGDSVGALLLSDGGLQFVTIFVLIIAIILFGILNILEGRELAAILSGIAGYILGRGAQAKAQASAGDTPEPQPATPVIDTPAAGASAIRVPAIFIPPPDAPQPVPALPAAAVEPLAATAETPATSESTPASEPPVEEQEPVAVG